MIRKLTESYLERILKGNENAVFSPVSMMQMLQMLVMGADGETREEIVRVAGEELPEVRGDALYSANALITREILKNSILPEYAEGMKKYFDGEIFATRDFVSEVNEWVRKKTFGQILEVADESMKDTILCLINATSFLARWERPFFDDEIFECEEFYNADGSVSLTDMLYGTERKVEDGDYIGFVKNYFGQEFSFMALLPKKEMSAPDLTGLFRQEDRSVVDVQFPEFRLTWQDELSSWLKELGIRRAFQPGMADFSRLSCEELVIEQVISKNCIEVDRQGTKAAAVNLTMMVAGCARMRNILFFDRPFLFTVMHNDTGLPVFAGVVNQVENKYDPEEEE